MNIYQYEEAFGAADKTSSAMRKAITLWYDLYYGTQQEGKDPCQRIAYTVVTKLIKAVFGEYLAVTEDTAAGEILKGLDKLGKEALGQTMVGGECYIKPCPGKNGFSFSLIPRKNVLVFGRNADGEVTDMGSVELSVSGEHYYTLLERRSVDNLGYLTIENRLYRARSGGALGTQVPLGSCPAYAHLMERYTYTMPVGSVGLVRMKTPMVNCVDGSQDGVSVYAAAAGLIGNIDENEAQLCGEFSRGESRILVSADLLRKDTGLTDHLFVGLNEDPQTLGITAFSPPLRQEAYLARKQEYLRNVESLIGLRRGMLSDANVEERTATEITSSAGDFNLTVLELQQMWEKAVKDTLKLCVCLAQLYRLPVPALTGISMDWGNGVLYDEAQTWAEYVQMVEAGLLKPEIALGWRFGMAAETQQQLDAIRDKYMPRQFQS